MPKRKSGKAKLLGFRISCPGCSGEAIVYELLGKGYWRFHCERGCRGFIYSPLTLERGRQRKPICQHNPEVKVCRDGSTTTYCSLCGIRTFRPPMLMSSFERLFNR